MVVHGGDAVAAMVTIFRNFKAYTNGGDLVCFL